MEKIHVMHVNETGGCDNEWVNMVLTGLTRFVLEQEQ